ncbi:MAG: hypothetical protein DLM72_21315 [Candidatus Nitrosopolaris wilkensis]|nr:MAG: hypothetical protein DLM72_21315 [Candidatus Nitrosopolaris wilkensis]
MLIWVMIPILIESRTKLAEQVMNFLQGQSMATFLTISFYGPRQAYFIKNDSYSGLFLPSNLAAYLKVN